MLKVSVIIPVYNVADYLDKCLDSVINQTYENLEIVIINDGSTDDSEKICLKYVSKDCRIKYIYQKNEGLSSARNAGLDACSGDCIFFLDSDDYLDKNAIELLCNLMSMERAEVVICDYLKVINDIEEGYISNKYLIYDIPNNIVDLYKSEETIIACAKLYKRDVIGNLRFPINRLHEDEFLTYKILFNCNRIAVTKSQIYMYRQRQGSIMHAKKINYKSYEDVFDALDEATIFFENKNENMFQHYLKRSLEYLRICINDVDNNKYMMKWHDRYNKVYLKYSNRMNIAFEEKIVYSAFRRNIILANCIERVINKKNRGILKIKKALQL